MIVFKSLEGSNTRETNEVQKDSTKTEQLRGHEVVYKPGKEAEERKYKTN